ncbi:MAG: A/G-specific adenine glycosylase [Bacteroidia bacterium]
MQNVLEILIWYKKKSRPLPWRQTTDPYQIWLSEVILQQTQVIQGLNYFHAFMEKYPSISDLASANEQDILKLWQGLGYYSRARNLLKTAKLIHNSYKNSFPDTYKELMKLPGIGDYTASAILSFAFNKPYPTLDGNVFRVISRLYNLDLPIDVPRNRSVYKEILENLIQGNDPRLFNNAMMELGATVCKPKQVQCISCPVQMHCMALKYNTVYTLPIKLGKTKKRNRYFNYLYITYKDKYYIHKREGKDIWENLYQLPLLETDAVLNKPDLISEINSSILSKSSFKLGKQKDYTHVLSHQTIEARFTHLICEEKPEFYSTEFVTVSSEKANNYPVPVLVEKFLLSL